LPAAEDWTGCVELYGLPLAVRSSWSSSGIMGSDNMGAWASLLIQDTAQCDRKPMS